MIERSFSAYSMQGPIPTSTRGVDGTGVCVFSDCSGVAPGGAMRASPPTLGTPMFFHSVFRRAQKEEKDFSLSAFIVQFSNFCCQRRLLFPAGGLHGVDHLFRLGKALHGIGISVVLQFHCGVEHEAASLEELRIL